MKDRIKKIRIDSKLNQTKFAQKIALSRSAICKIESGENNPSEQTLRLICKEFNINYNWLTKGIGTMYNETDNDDFTQYVEDLLNNNDNPLYTLIKEIMLTYKKLDDKSKTVLNNFIDSMVSNLKNDTTTISPQHNPNIVISKELENYRLELESASKGGISSVSTTTSDTEEENTN